jgi:hypothetical protein
MTKTGGKTLDLTEDRKKELRNFGGLVGMVLIGIGTFRLLKGEGINYYLFLPGAILCLSGILYPQILSPFHAAWMKIGHVLGRINSFILLSVVFYVVVTPMRLLHLLFSKERNFGFRTGAASYWIKRSPDPDNFRETMKRQF